MSSRAVSFLAQRSLQPAALYLGFRAPAYGRMALIFSLLLHAVLLSVKFVYPSLRELSNQLPLEVFLVNSRTRSAPIEAQALAQANLDGGGNTEQNRRIKTPLPAKAVDQPAQELQQTLQQQQLLEQQAQQLFTQLKASSHVSMQAIPVKPQPTANLDAGQLLQKSLEIARLEGQISKNMEIYQKRPKRQFIGAQAKEFRFARYVDDWRLKIERVGTLNYPQEAKDKNLHGSLQLTVSIRSDGQLEAIEINRSSGNPMLDEAAKRIVKLAAPFSPFPEDIRRDTDILSITRTWHFTQQDQLSGED